MKDELLLDVKNLQTHFFTKKGTVRAVNGVDFQIKPGETVGLVGESGCGKTMTALSIMGLVPPPGRVVQGKIIYRGLELSGMGKRRLREIRGNEIAMVFQNPMTSLNPVFSVGKQIIETIQIHRRNDRRKAKERAQEMLELVGISDPDQRMGQFPHQFSGGMSQRIVIAIALCCNPGLLIADEPTTALDVTIQAQIVELVRRLKDELGMAVLWITHDLGVVAGFADRVIVMYAGNIIESGAVDEIYENPRHPYTMGLLRSIPYLDDPVHDKLPTISGQPPSLIDPLPGCPFAPRCSYASDQCLAENPPLMPTDGQGHLSACWRWVELEESGAR